jgi:hypothetical protein
VRINSCTFFSSPVDDCVCQSYICVYVWFKWDSLASVVKVKFFVVVVIQHLNFVCRRNHVFFHLELARSLIS